MKIKRRWHKWKLAFVKRSIKPVWIRSTTVALSSNRPYWIYGWIVFGRWVFSHYKGTVLIRNAKGLEVEPWGGWADYGPLSINEEICRSKLTRET